MSAVRERPILFSGPMVRAILEGRKVLTRRVWKMPREHHWYPELGGETEGFLAWDKGGAPITVDEVTCPFGCPGDRLWVRETWAHVPSTAYRCSTGVKQVEDPMSPGMAAVYAAGWERSAPGRWRPSIHMPRWACRLVLEITYVRVERLQDISEADACAEGMGSPITRDCKVPKFAALWDELNGAGAWDANPWVWVIGFQRVEVANG